MKFVISLLTTLIAISASAGEFTNYSRILFQAADTWVPANRVCVNRNNLYHTRRDYIEKVQCFGREEDNCSVWERIPLIQPVNSMRLRCSAYEGDDECIKREPVSFNQGLRVRVDIYSNANQFHRHEEPRERAWYRIPNCF